MNEADLKDTIRAVLVEVLSDALDGIVKGSTSPAAPRSAPEPHEAVWGSPAEPEWGGLADSPTVVDVIPNGPAMGVRDLMSRLEKVDKIPAAAGWAKKHYGTGSFKNLTDQQRGAVAVAFHVA